MLNLLALLLISPPSPHVSLSNPTVLGSPVSVLTVNLNEPKVRVGILLADGFPGTDQEFKEIVARGRPHAAVNGAYFSMDSKKPIGDLVVDGTLVSAGRMGTALTFDAKGKPDIMRVERHKTMKWEGFKTVLACGPALILDGAIDVQFEKEGFRDPHVTGSAARMAVGYTPKNKLIIALIRNTVTFQEEAQIMQSLGCYEAMNLDAGASLAMYHAGKIVQPPSRPLTNVLAIWAD